MKNICCKSLVISTLMAFHMACASGIYLVSGGDFRPYKIKYSVKTQEPGETVTITPYSLGLLSSLYDRKQYQTPWYIKTNGEEFKFTHQECINRQTTDGTHVGPYGCTNVAPVSYTYSEPGTYLVKISDMSSNIYDLDFSYATNIISIFIDWRNLTEFNYGFKMLNSPDVKMLNLGNQESVKNQQTPNLRNLPSIETIKFAYPENYTSISTYFCNSCKKLKSDMIFTNATAIGANAFKDCGMVNVAQFPKATSIGSQVFHLGGFGVLGTNGLHSLRIGDCLSSIGQNAFYSQSNLKTLEFVSDRDDWIQFWNSSEMFSKWGGTLAPVDGNPDEAVVSVLPTKDGTYWTSTGFLKLDRVVRIRRTPISQSEQQ